ncbi:hypothetical protein [Actinoplanes sp. NBRC 103695]|uniref:hypothetical protein n=1 Tax=Actinoplanes sp. NBRC 103695 TaxID=3032202 RepID=UPI0024A58180|nr:hypothetical protein [Actinoplanes sp. NBRC 103695]GLY94836.1 hypothetical protein Acsp02_20910 [Actinoplanes sp. NBRC 103695]
MSQPPYPGPPDPWSSGQPQSGQPYSGQPQPGQPSSGQPWPGQPAPNPQQYPPTQPYQPAQPPYPPSQQPYPGPPQQGGPYAPPPTPDYGPPPPDYGQQQYAQPGYPVMTPVKPKSRALPITLVSIAVFLVLCVGGTTAVVLVARNTTDSVNEAVDDYTPPPLPSIEPLDPAPTTEAPAGKTITIVEPRTLGGRPKLTDDQFKGITEQLKSDLANIPNARNTVGALYGKVAKQDIVVIAGVAADVDNPAQELNGTFLGAGVGGLKVTGITSIKAGPLGGVAKCGKADASGTDMVLCAWADEGSVGWIIWYFKTITKAKAEFAKLRGEIEKSS